MVMLSGYGKPNDTRSVARIATRSLVKYTLESVTTLASWRMTNRLCCFGIAQTMSAATDGLSLAEADDPVRFAHWKSRDRDATFMSTGLIRSAITVTAPVAFCTMPRITNADAVCASLR